MKTTLQYKGYSIHIENDEHAENPFENFDCEPPILTYSYDRGANFKAYNDAPETIRGFVDLLPDSLFARGARVALIKENLNCSLREFVESKNYHGTNDRDTFAQILSEDIGSKPEGWRDACAWFECVESLLKLAGIPCHYTESNGYSQGDTVKLLSFAPASWRELVGAPLESCESQCENACNLYGAWAWGDVYGIASITAPGGVDEDGDELEGEELDEGSVWGFYGSDHTKSGLLDAARETIDCHIASTAAALRTAEASAKRVAFLSRNMSLA